MMDFAQRLHEAVALHRAGALDEAGRRYRELLEVRPDDADVLHLLGAAAYQQGDYRSAVEWIGRALVRNPGAALYRCTLGTAQRGLGLWDEAEASFRGAVESDPTFAGAHYNLASLLEARGRTEEAIASYERAVQCDPSMADAFNNLGRVLGQVGRLEESIGCYRRVVELRPRSGEARYNLANSLARAGRREEAIGEFRESLRFNPNHAESHNNLGAALRALERFDEAAESFLRAVALKPGYAEAHNNLGAIYHFRGEFALARAHYCEAVGLDPRFAGALTNLANLDQDEGFIDRAIAGYDQALTIDPNSSEAGFNRALALLRKGDFARGWASYEWRWKRHVARRSFGREVWDGSALFGRSILLYAEQGIGDEIMFASCVPDVIAQAAGVILECDPRLVTLFTRSFPGVHVVARPLDHRLSDEMHPQAQLECALGSLPRRLRSSLDSFPRRSYLVADSAAREGCRERLRTAGGRLVVGISWRGGLGIEVRSKRSTALVQWREILSVPGVTFVNLQHGEVAAELEALRRETGMTVDDWPEFDLRNDLEHLAARVAAVDLVISVDNSTVHLAGALGVPVWTLLPYAADWRWLFEREDSPWYPSMRLFRQLRPGDWDEVFERVAAHLRELVARKSKAA